MFPILFSIGNLFVSSFGVFLALGFLLGIFLIWRLCRAWDLDEEKILDLTLLTFLGSLVGARVYFAIEHLPLFISVPLNLIHINKIPGFSFWGGFLGGWLTLYLFAKRSRLNFLQLTDIATVGLLGGLLLSDIGCFLGACNVGIPSKILVAVNMAGYVGKRWPIQAVEALLFLVSLKAIWSQATHFHQRGKITSLGLIYIGVISLLLEPLKQNHSGLIFSIVLILLGLTIFYKISKQNPITHLKSLAVSLRQIFTDPVVRKRIMQNFKKSWYNQKTTLGWRIRSLKKILRRSNVKFS